MITTTTANIPGKEVSEILGISRGSTVRARNIGRDILAGLKNIVGGEISEYTRLQAQSLIWVSSIIFKITVIP